MLKYHENGGSNWLDNLKLGYGGTKEEMKRLISDAAKLDSSIDANSTSFGNLVKAIHVVQENMGITGTTAKEASETISGSLASMKSAWGNLMPALIKGGDSFDQCVDNLVSTVKTFAKNVMPAIRSALSGVGTLIDELAPIIAKELPSLISEILPKLISATESILNSLIKALPKLISSVLPAAAKAIAKLMISLGKTIVSNAPKLYNAAKNLVVSVAQAIYEGFTGQQMSGDMFATLKSKVDTAFTAIKNIINGVIQFGQTMLTALAPVLSFIGNLVLNVFSWIGNNINWLLPLVTALGVAFLAYKAI